eukprot:CAMPEP_0178404042 /NCGR_PEP_ID=MMETSP0689_2-20121128/17677_1 /TAXON_ID=160604 /ORGANISM="Amphidinium massartii, Strain CS-259" /LENGTH=256 /DNA_ID=CAMNT_0020025009 /DNA_START=492 /DNA_END=1262 /DNA_ORIENTATION=-
MDRHIGYHEGVGTFYPQLKGHLMMVVREPTSRLISAYNFHYHSWPYNKRHVQGIKAYARVLKGQFLKMLVRDFPLWTTSTVQRRADLIQRPSKQEVHEAHKRLREGFAFVGIAEEWALSMCLFHALFGGECVTAEFWKIHPSEETRQQRRERSLQEKALSQWRDPYDGPLYKDARRHFKEELKRFGVSDNTCGRCWRRAGLLHTYHNPVGGKFAEFVRFGDAPETEAAVPSFSEEAEEAVHVDGSPSAGKTISRRV